MPHPAAVHWDLFIQVDSPNSKLNHSDESASLSGMSTIPPPRNLSNLWKRSSTIFDLRQAMGADWDENAFHNFRKHVQSSAETSGLDMNQVKEHQDEAKWLEFENKALVEFPQLEHYENHWPLTAYFNKWITNRQHHARRPDAPFFSPPVDRTRIRNPSPRAEKWGSDDSDSTSEDERPLSSQVLHKAAGKRRIKDAGDGPSAKRLATTSAKDAEPKDDVPKATTCTPLAGSKRYYIGQNPNTIGRLAKPALPSKAAVAQQSEDESDSDSDSSKRDRQSTQSNRAESLEPSAIEWPFWCVFCGRAPPVPERCTQKLRRLFDDEVLGVFVTIGILHDLHLRVLAALNESQRQTFLLSLVPGHLNQFKAGEIAEVLDVYAAEHAEKKLPGGEIEVCPRHQPQHTVDVPSELLLILEARGMEEVGPAAVFLGIESNAQFQAVRNFKPETKQKMIFDNMKEIKPSSFQKLMLEVALSPAS
ncbi:hypothetical protein B0H17DRAFT_232002 [Mycena rosella]|uniref:Uncharacterized protein n=1 Tax=Mycena rosella TaxID=1033263 RepID=A0AAD7H1A0_MYCRO|nr:hypothetical protein B0H17DRAFT_232002 [Mycena rosella]